MTCLAFYLLGAGSVIIAFTVLSYVADNTASKRTMRQHAAMTAMLSKTATPPKGPKK